MVLLPATHRWFGHLSVMTTWSWSLPACVIQVTSFALTEKTTCSWEKLIFGSHYASCHQNRNPSLKCSYVHWWVLSVSGKATAWRHAPMKQIIILTVLSLGISLKWVSNMGYSLYFVDPYESLLHAMVKKKRVTWRQKHAQDSTKSIVSFTVLAVVTWNSGITVLLHAHTHSCQRV